MARTYPAKRARIAKVADVRIVVAIDVDELPVYAEPYCLGCNEIVAEGDRVVGDYWGQPNGVALMHARCADAGEALP